MLQMAMRALGFEPRREEIKKIISTVTKDDSDSISEDQFVEIMSEKIAEKDTREEILKAFRLFDDDQTGKISFKNLKRVAEELGENLTDEELREMIQEADKDNDGEVNQDEFLRIMKKTCLYWCAEGYSTYYTAQIYTCEASYIIVPYLSLLSILFKPCQYWSQR